VAVAVGPTRCAKGEGWRLTILPEAQIKSIQVSTPRKTQHRCRPLPVPGSDRRAAARRRAGSGDVPRCGRAGLHTSPAPEAPAGTLDCVRARR
jgi:hypothetical protein